jgi:hypothetical protein
MTLSRRIDSRKVFVSNRNKIGSYLALADNIECIQVLNWWLKVCIGTLDSRIGDPRRSEFNIRYWQTLMYDSRE